jgi:hypothetical protein
MPRRSLPLVLVAAIGCVLFAACGGGRSPRITAQLFLEHVAKGKLTEAKQYATEQTGQFLDFAASMNTIPSDPEFKFDFVSENITGDKAVVKFKDKEGSEEDIDLLKVDGEWKVHIKKE